MINCISTNLSKIINLSSSCVEEYKNNNYFDNGCMEGTNDNLFLFSKIY